MAWTPTDDTSNKQGIEWEGEKFDWEGVNSEVMDLKGVDWEKDEGIDDVIKF